VPTQLSDDEIARSHRWHAVECNNRAWTLADASARTSAEDDEMIDAAHAASFHWAKVGTDLHRARARLLLAHVHAAVNHGEQAMAYARSSADYLLSHEPPDWEAAFAHAVLAHAASAFRDDQLHNTEYRKAEELGKAIADAEDRQIFLNSFARIPKPRVGIA
jgi:hypothetical protein